MDVLTRDIGHGAPALDVRPEWCSKEVGALYAQWQRLPRQEDREEWVLSHYQTNPLIIEAMELYKQGIVTPRDAVDNIRGQWFQAKETVLLTRLTSSPVDRKARILNELMSFYGGGEGKAHEIDMLNPPERNNPLLSIDGNEFLVRHEITAIKAKAKSGKSHLSMILASALISDYEVLKVSHVDEKPMRVLFVDTEQSLWSSYKMTKRILSMAGRYDERAPKNSELLKTVNLRMMRTNERMPYLRGLIATGKYDVVILDGIKDLAADINDNKEADNIISGVMMLCEEYSIAMLTVLHENPSKDDDKMRGHIGTELLNKAHDVFEIVFDQDAGVFNIYHTDSRERPIPDWGFRFNDNDELEACEPSKAKNQGQGQGQKREDREMKNWYMVVNAFSDNYDLAYTKEELIALMAKKCDLTEGTAKNRIKYFYHKHWLGIMGGSEGDKGARYYIMPEKLTEYKSRNYIEPPPKDEGQVPF